MLKTGVREGPNKGKSFYMCSQMPQSCGFTTPARIVLGNDYTGYANALQHLGLTSLVDRREQLCLKFARTLMESTFREWLPSPPPSGCLKHAGKTIELQKIYRDKENQLW
ncbi:transcription termination factor, RNA polymerase II [Branchiostoma belcheri]|nr:transcription termination factor, RNA polymerase II [Branchiostoma belcheri]